MKVLIVLCASMVLAYAKPGHLIAATPLVVAPVAPYASQYHAQDELGQYSYGYANQQSSKAEVKTADGITQGAYSYVDPAGKLQSVSYTSDAVHGFRVAGTNIPEAPAVPAVPVVPVVPEVKATIVAEEKKDDVMVEMPMPVEDTPEVKAAKEQHFQAVKEAKALAEEHKQVFVPAVPAVSAAYVATPYVHAVPAVYPAYAPYYYHPAVHGYSYSTYNYPAVAAAYYAHPIMPHIPAVPADTPEVAKAKAEHMAAHEKARSL